MSKKQCQMQPYRAAQAVDSAGAPTDAEKAAFLLTTFGFDGVRFNYTFIATGAASATVKVWFYDSKNDMWTPDESLTQTLGASGSGTFRIETNGRPMLLKITALSLPAGAAPRYLAITQGAYSDSKV